MAKLDATRACVVCGNALTSKMDKKCCGAECSAEHRRRWMADRWNQRKPELPRRQCVHCSAEFLTPHAKQKYCTSACRSMAAQAQGRELSRCCVVCGREFARNGKVSLCSDECRAIRQRDHGKASALRNGHIKGPQQLTCAHCKLPFVGVAGKAFCSARCKGAERRKSPAYARDQAKWRGNNRDAIRERGKQYKTRVRAERGRGDRSSEYAAQRSRRHAPTLAAMLWLDAGYYAAHAEALLLNAEIDRAARARRRAEREAERGLTEADKWRWKYRNDPEFRQAQIQRLKAQKIKRKKQTEFGMTKAEVLAVYAERSSCLYCGCRLDDKGKVLDHMDPLSKGGSHDISNLVVACKSCNTRKAAKLFIDWLQLVPEARHAMVAKVYAKKHGAPVEQCGLGLAMKAA